MNCPFTEKHVVLTPWFLFSPYSIFKGYLCVSSNIADITHNLTFLCFLVEEKPALKKKAIQLHGFRKRSVLKIIRSKYRALDNREYLMIIRDKFC